MRSMIFGVAAFVSFLISHSAVAQQKRISEPETQHIFFLIRQTKDYKTLEARKDSFNNAQVENAALQELDIEITVKVKYDADPNIIYATVNRNIAGFSLDCIRYTYNKTFDKITDITKASRNAIVMPGN